MSSKTQSNEFPPFTPVLRGLDDHLEAGRFTPTSHSVYVLLLGQCDYETGVYYGGAKSIWGLYGYVGILKPIQDALAHLKKNKFIQYRDGDGKKGNYKITVLNHIVRQGEQKGKRVNTSKTLRLQESSKGKTNGGRTVDERSANGGRMVDGRCTDGGRSVDERYQEVQEFKEVQEGKNLRIEEVGLTSSDGINQSGSPCYLDGVELGSALENENLGIEKELSVNEEEKQKYLADQSARDADRHNYVPIGAGMPPVKAEGKRRERKTTPVTRTQGIPDPTSNVGLGSGTTPSGPLTTYLYGLLGNGNSSADNPISTWEGALLELQAKHKLTSPEMEKFLHWAIVENIDPKEPTGPGSSVHYLSIAKDPIASLQRNFTRLLKDYKLSLRVASALSGKKSSDDSLPEARKEKYSIANRRESLTEKLKRKKLNEEKQKN